MEEKYGLRSQQMTMSEIYMDNLNTACPLSHCHNGVWELVYLGIPMYSYVTGI